MAARLLRQYGKAPGFTIHDRSDSEDLLDVIRAELGLAQHDKRFPRKGTCLSIYSRCAGAERPIEEVVPEAFPWCEPFLKELKGLFRAYCDRKEQAAVLDDDDLLLFWRGLLEQQRSGEIIREKFDCVLVDEYQDTNRLQADILRRLCPDGGSLTVVGDDAQAIYSFRAATVRNILDFPEEFPGTTVIKLEENYRSSQPLLEATNRLIAESAEGYAKQLFSCRHSGEKPELVACQDEEDQAAFLLGEILARREDGVELQLQAVLYRASFHTVLLEAELARHGIPYVKYGGLKFAETAHVKDLLAFLRLAENPRDLVAGTRVLQLLPKIGPKTARRRMDELNAAGGKFAVWSETNVAAAAADDWKQLVKLLRELTTDPSPDVPAQIGRVRRFYEPFLEEKHNHAETRKRDLEQLEQLAGRYENRSRLLAEVALDPPETSEDFAGAPDLDEDYLVLSTIHSAKGLEWESVYVIHAADGNIPSDMATGSSEQIEEERRLFYVALTRAANRLVVCYPLRYYHAVRGPRSDAYGYAQLSRFISEQVKSCFTCRTTENVQPAEEQDDETVPEAANIRQRTRAMWS